MVYVSGQLLAWPPWWVMCPLIEVESLESEQSWGLRMTCEALERLSLRHIWVDGSSSVWQHSFVAIVVGEVFSDCTLGKKRKSAKDRTSGNSYT